MSSKNNDSPWLTPPPPRTAIREVQRDLATLFGSLRELKNKAPAPAATGARAGNQRLGSNRLAPLYVNPFGGANAIASAATIITTEARRRQDCFARTAKKFG